MCANDGKRSDIGAEEGSDQPSAQSTLGPFRPTRPVQTITSYFFYVFLLFHTYHIQHLNKRTTLDTLKPDNTCPSFPSVNFNDNR